MVPYEAMNTQRDSANEGRLEDALALMPVGGMPFVQDNSPGAAPYPFLVFDDDDEDDDIDEEDNFDDMEDDFDDDFDDDDFDDDDDDFEDEEDDYDYEEDVDYDEFDE
ncbi:hypothetical protein AGMMS49546_38590 [Spirochaetia bacterium]|nr:hypothetical protein AGMMS49546_38590 [Spirochaetia bacterium]